MGVQSVVTVLKDGPLPRVGVPIDLASSDDPRHSFGKPGGDGGSSGHGGPVGSSSSFSSPA